MTFLLNRLFNPVGLAAMFDNVNRLWFLLPLAATISLAYNASRYELTGVILHRSAFFFGKTLLFLGLIFLVLWFLSAGL